MTPREFFDLYRGKIIEDTAEGDLFIVVAFDSDDSSVHIRVIPDPRTYSLITLDEVRIWLKDYPHLQWDTTYKVFGSYSTWLYPNDLKKYILAYDQSVKNTNYICPVCKNPAYIGFMKIECLNKCYG